jgi:hypothetical protein
MIRQSFDEPKEKLKSELAEQNAKLERIRKAYINGAFDLNVYNAETAVVEKAINNLKAELEATDCSEELRFTPKDILLKRDIDFINKMLFTKEYEEQTKTWKDYTREEQAELIMRYVDEIKLKIIGTEVIVDEINFRESICKPCQELYDKGYIDTTKPMLLGNILGNVRFSNYLPEEEFGEIIMRLQQYYDVHFAEATYYLQKQMFYFDFSDNKAIVRVFPLEDYYKLDPDNKMEKYRFGIIYIDGDDEFRVEDIENIEPYFNAIPDDSETTLVYKKDEPVEIVVKPVNFSKENTE